MKELPKTMFMRILRVIPAYVVGPLVNAELKEFFHSNITKKITANMITVNRVNIEVNLR